MMRMRLVCLLCLSLPFYVATAQEDWFGKAFPRHGRMDEEVKKSSSLIKIVYDANVICTGAEANLSVDCSLYGPEENLAFEWFQLGESGRPLGSGPTLAFKALVEQETSISVRVTEGDAFIGADTVRIYVTRLPDYTTVYDTICPGMEATVGVDGGGYWAWSTSGTSSFINIRPAQTTIYRVRVSNYPIVQSGYINVCYAEDSAVVTVNDSAIFSVSGDREMCAGSDATVWVEGGTDTYWNNEPGESSRQIRVIRDTVITVVATDRFGCRGIRKWPIKVVENPHGEIVAYVDGELSDSVCLGSSVRIEVESDMDCRYRWFNHDTLGFVEIYPQADFTAYCDIFVGGSLQGTLCKNRLSKAIAVRNCHKVYFASGYVLDGFTKTYGPIGVEDTSRTYEFRIFNPNGTMVFHTTKFTEGWDGRYKGKQVPPGVYVYVYREKYRQHSWERRGTVAVIK